jgi:hypothetical protein
MSKLYEKPSALKKEYPELQKMNFINFFPCVKVSVRIHNMNTDRLKFDWVLPRRPVNVFLYLGTGPGSLLAET